MRKLDTLCIDEAGRGMRVCGCEDGYAATQFPARKADWRLEREECSKHSSGHDRPCNGAREAVTGVVTSLRDAFSLPINNYALTAISANG